VGSNPLAGQIGGVTYHKPVSRSLWEVDLPTGNPSIRISEPKALN
jgi:hypothetical protein